MMQWDDWNNIRLHKRAMLHASWSDAFFASRPSMVTLNKNRLHSSLPHNNKDCYQWHIWMTNCRQLVNCPSWFTRLALYFWLNTNGFIKCLRGHKAVGRDKGSGSARNNHVYISWAQTYSAAKLNYMIKWILHFMIKTVPVQGYHRVNNPLVSQAAERPDLPRTSPGKYIQLKLEKLLGLYHHDWCL